MHQLKFRVKNLAPLVFSAKFGDNNMVSTQKYIPGTSVLGMLAKRFLTKQNISSKNACQNEYFHKFFLSGQVCFNNAYIVFKDKDGEEFTHYPTPFSVQKEKRGHEIYDLLKFEEDKFTKHVENFCHLDSEYIRIKEVETSLNFHHARDSKTGAPKQGIIFNYESLASGQNFEGSISGNIDDLKHLKKMCGTEFIGYAGRSKNAQYGKIQFEFLCPEPKPVNLKLDNTKEVSMTFVSDTIVYNKNGFSCTDKDVLETYLGLTIKKSFIKKGEIENFVGVWRLKKPSENCFLAGSGFLLEINNKKDMAKLEEFQKNGIGERTHEGFGQCVFDWQKEDELCELEYKPTEESEDLEKPDNPVPETAKKVLKTLIRNAFLKKVELEAIDSSKNFKHLPSNSLIGRLGSMSSNMNQKDFIDALKDEPEKDAKDNKKDTKKQLKETAKKQLKLCRNQEKTLLDFLIEKTINLQDICTSLRLNELCSEIGFMPESDKSFQDELSHVYFSAFFSMMRKSVQNKEDI